MKYPRESGHVVGTFPCHKGSSHTGMLTSVLGCNVVPAQGRWRRALTMPVPSSPECADRTGAQSQAKGSNSSSHWHNWQGGTSPTGKAVISLPVFISNTLCKQIISRLRTYRSRKFSVNYKSIVMLFSKSILL